MNDFIVQIEPSQNLTRIYLLTSGYERTNQTHVELRNLVTFFTLSEDPDRKEAAEYADKLAQMLACYVEVLEFV